MNDVPTWNGAPITPGWWWLQFSDMPGPRYWDGTFWTQGSCFSAAEDYAAFPILGPAIPPGNHGPVHASSESEHTAITPDALLMRGYRVYPGQGGEARFFQKAFDDDVGRRYFIEFLEWCVLGIRYETKICCATDTDGYAWLTFREPTIEQAEARAETLWQAAGGCYYEMRNADIMHV